ncbi:hypothetical protein HDV03_003899 [Kappamyces sp. JEL0829]|nr:hypothetical protein HDV03_003899 [Kappamyces sp. JEL0829]
MKSIEIQRAWREKVALCKPETVFTISQVKAFGSGNNEHSVVIYGGVYDMSGVLTSHDALPYFKANVSQAAAINKAAGIDVSPYFRHSLSSPCQNRLQAAISFPCSSEEFPGSVHCHDWSSVSGLLTQMYVGPVYYGWDDVASNSNFVVFDGKVLNLTTYLSAKSPIFGEETDAVIRQNLNTDVTKAITSINDGDAIGQCLTDLFNIGRLEAISTGCWTSQVILYVSFVIVMGLVMVRFTFAVYFRWFLSNQLGKIMKDSQTRKVEPSRRVDLDQGRFPITMSDQEGNLIVKHSDMITPFRGSLPRRSLTRKSKSNYGSEVHTIMLVTCYSEDTSSLKLTLDSLAATEYNEDYKMLLIISDGLIKGQGNAKSTPELILDLLELDSNWPDPLPMSYLAVAEGAKQHNMAKVYVAWYNYQGHSVPTILVVKCGLPTEQTKPGNRGKRDSQMILMRFLERITFNQRLCPLEYELFLKMNYLMGTSPDCFQIVLMVDADTKVAPDSLARMVACMVRDPTVMGLCGETRIANKNDSWVSRIQVFEYYLSHHMTKAFESMSDPGCFCMYRIKAMKGDSWIPILCSPEIIATYSQSVVDTLHKKNLLLLGEDRFLTTLMLRAFPRRKLIFVPRAFCKTTVPNTFMVLLSQRRRWINSTIHNLMELILVNELCGIFCFSMQFVIFLELVGTVTLPAAICFTL